LEKFFLTVWLLESSQPSPGQEKFLQKSNLYLFILSGPETPGWENYLLFSFSLFQFRLSYTTFLHRFWAIFWPFGWQQKKWLENDIKVKNSLKTVQKMPV